MDSELQPQLFVCFTSMNHNYGNNQLTVENIDTDKVDLNLPITVHKHDLLTLLSQTSAAVIDGNEKHNDWFP